MWRWNTDCKIEIQHSKFDIRYSKFNIWNSKCKACKSLSNEYLPVALKLLLERRPWVNICKLFSCDYIKVALEWIFAGRLHMINSPPSSDQWQVKHKKYRTFTNNGLNFTFERIFHVHVELGLIIVINFITIRHLQSGLLIVIILLQ